jgi:3-carboxy-cis,cis-muconate cycloisomerase
MSVTALDSPFLGNLFGSGTVRSLFEARAVIERYLEVEIALAEVEAALGLIPAEAGAAIASELTIDRIDFEKYARDVERVGFPIVPLLEQIAQVVPDGYGQYAHWGATTQDIMDTALVLQIREALRHIKDRLSQLRSILADHADRHRSTVMLGRSQLQHALPITFGLKAATWLSMFQRHAARLAQLEERLYVVQLGGAVGTLAALGTNGEAVQRALAAKLGLGVTPTSWHTARDSLAEAIAFLANVAASLGKIGQDIVLLAQSDVQEVHERAVPGRGVSSTMPQKHNPVSSQLLTVIASGVADHAAAMLRASVHDHERASGRWMREWRIVPDAFVLTGRAFDVAVDLLEGLEIDGDRMRANVEAAEFITAEAVMMALAPHLGRQRAHDVVARAVQTAAETRTPFRSVLSNMTEIAEHLSDDDLGRILRPDNYLGATEALIDHALANEEPRSTAGPIQ